MLDSKSKPIHVAIVTVSGVFGGGGMSIRGDLDWGLDHWPLCVSTDKVAAAIWCHNYLKWFFLISLLGFPDCLIQLKLNSSISSKLITEHFTKTYKAINWELTSHTRNTASCVHLSQSAHIRYSITELSDQPWLLHTSRT